jgi:hypothetical protein
MENIDWSDVISIGMEIDTENKKARIYVKFVNNEKTKVKLVDWNKRFSEYRKVEGLWLNQK